MNAAHHAHPAHSSSFTLWESNMAGWKIPELNGGVIRKITDFNGLFSSTPCLITGGYEESTKKVLNILIYVCLSVYSICVYTVYIYIHIYICVYR